MKSPYVLLLPLLLLSGCYESPDATLHEPHVYKGKDDDHHYVSKNIQEALAIPLRGGFHERDLRLRFKQVQTDR